MEINNHCINLEIQYISDYAPFTVNIALMEEII